MYWLQSFVLSSAGCLAWAIGRLLLVGRQDCCAHGSKSLLVDLDGSAAEPSSKEWCSCSSHRPVRRTDPSFQRVIRATIDQVDAAATTVTRRLPERGSPSSELIAAYMQLQATVPKKLGSVDVTATMQALEELLGATSNGVESVAFLLAAAPLGDAADVCRALPSASQASDGGTSKCQIGKKIETAEDLVALLSARVDLLALQLVKDGTAVATEASHGGFADVVVMASALSCSLLKSYEEPCEYALSSEWHWTAELLRCLSVHVLTAAAYHEFWSEVHHSRYWLQKSVETLESQFSSKALAARADGTDAEALIADLRRSIDTYVHWQSRLVGLSERARAVAPLQLRARPLPAGRPAPPGRALVAYETEEVALCEGESLTVLETSASSPLWRVRTALGQETLVPSLVVELTAPDAAALDAALVLRQQLLALWTAHVRLLGRRLVALLSSSFTDVVVCTSSTAAVQDCTSLAPRFRMDEQQQQKFVTVGQLLQRVLQQLGKDGVKCSQLSGLWHTLASLVDGEAAMLPEGAANSRRKDAPPPPLLAAHLQSIELLLVRFEDFVAYWNAYNAFVTQQQQSKLIFLAETKQFTHFITTAHYVRFYNVELQSSLANNSDSLALGDHAAVLPASATDGVTGHGDQSNLWGDGAAKHFLHKDPAADAPKVTCIPPATTAAVAAAAFDQLRCAAYSDSLAELKRSAFDVHEHWLQVTRLLLCQKAHLRNAAAYHEFWHEVQDAKLSLNCLLSKLQTPAGAAAAAATTPSRERIGSLKAEINDALNEYMLWQSKFDRLSDEARRIIPLNQRVKITADRPVQGKAMCAYVTGEVSLAEGDPLTVLEADAASSPFWLVHTADGREVRLPSVSIQLLGPDSLALDAASRLHAQLAALWVGTARRFGPRVGALLRKALVEATQRPADSGKRRASAVGSKGLQRLIGLAELLKACCGGDCGLPQKEAAALQDAIDACSAALSSADAASDAVDGQEPLEEEDASSLEELLLSYQDFCAYYGQYVIDVEALRQPKYITLYNPDAGSLRFVTMAYFPRVYNVTLMGVGAVSLLSPTADATSGKLEDDSTARLTTVAADEALPDEEMATQGSAHEADEPLLAVLSADGQLQQAIAFEPPAAVEEAGPPAAVEEAGPPAAVEEAGPPAADDATADGSGGDGSWAYGQSSSLTEEGEPAGEDDEDGSRGDGTDRNVRRLRVAGVGETESQDGQIGSFEAGSCGQGEEEEVSYFESSAMEQQVSTEGVMESEMEVTTTFVITGVMCNPGAPDEELCSLQEALDRLVIDPQNNQYVMRNGSKVTRLTIGEAMEAGYIKMGPKTERKTAEKIKSAAIITVKTIAERYPYTVKSAVNTKTQATLTEAEAVAAGIIDLTKHTFRDLESNEVMLIGDAVSLHLVDIVHDKNASGVIHEEVSKKFNVHSVLDERRRERIEFQVAVRRGIIEEGTGSYVSSLTGQKLFAAEAIEKGFIEASVVSSNVANGS